jgi:hypothetical protein
MDAIDQLFQDPGCCESYSTELQQLIALYYYEASTFMFAINDSIYAAEIFGKPTEQLYNRQNDFHYLLALLVMIYYERQDHVLWEDDGTDYGIEYYYVEHNLECIRNNFLCKGYDIIGLLRIFDLDPDAPDLPLDGINYMHITQAPLGHNKFIVR